MESADIGVGVPDDSSFADPLTAPPHEIASDEEADGDDKKSVSFPHLAPQAGIEPAYICLTGRRFTN